MVDVHAEDPGGLRVLRHRSHAPAEPGLVHEQRKTDHHQQRTADDHHVANLYVEGANPDERLSGVPDTAEGVRLTLPSAVSADRLRDGEGSTDGGDEEDEPGRVAFAQWPVREELERRGRPGREDDREEEHHDERADEGQAALEEPGCVAGRDAEHLEGDQGAKGPDDEHLGVREVDEAQHAVDERVAKGDEGVDGTQRKTGERVGPERAGEVREAQGNPRGASGGDWRRERQPGYRRSVPGCGTRAGDATISGPRVPTSFVFATT